MYFQQAMRAGYEHKTWLTTNTRIACVAALIILALLAIDGASATSASAACKRVKPGEPSKYKKRIAGLCFGTTTVNGFVKTEGAGVPVAGEPGVECYRVEPGEPSSWKNSLCTMAKSSTGEWIKIQEPASISCEEESGELARIAPRDAFAVDDADNGFPVSQSSVDIAPGQKTVAVQLTFSL